MGEQPVHLLLARRTGEGAETPELERAFEAERIERLPVGPLSLGAIHTLLQARLGRTFSRPSLLRVHETSGGNPFYALELARVLGADVDPTRPLRVPESLEGLVRARLDDLAAATRDAVLLASALGRPTAELLANLGVTERCPRAGARRSGDRVRRRDDSLYPPAPRVGALPERSARRATARARTSRTDRRGSARPGPSPRAFDGEPGPEIAADLEHAATPWPAPAVPRSSPPSLASTRFG